MALRTFTRPGVFLAGATTISQPATIEPPFRDPVQDKMTPDKHSEPWNAFFTELAKRLSDIQASGGVIFGVPPGATTYFGNASDRWQRAFHCDVVACVHNDVRRLLGCERGPRLSRRDARGHDDCVIQL